jgi:hypothetical protein
MTCPPLSVHRAFAIVPVVKSPESVTLPVAPIVVKLAAAAVLPPIAPGEANVAPFSEEAFRFGTLVVLATVKGAVPVDVVLVKVGAVMPFVKVCAAAPR